jgi:hypothetical protein
MQVKIERVKPRVFRVLRGDRVCCEGDAEQKFCAACVADVGRAMASADAWRAHFASNVSEPPDLFARIRAARGLDARPTARSGGVSNPPDLVALIQERRRR